MGCAAVIPACKWSRRVSSPNDPWQYSKTQAQNNIQNASRWVSIVECALEAEDIKEEFVQRNGVWKWPGYSSLPPPTHIPSPFPSLANQRLGVSCYSTITLHWASNRHLAPIHKGSPSPIFTMQWMVLPPSFLLQPRPAYFSLPWHPSLNSSPPLPFLLYCLSPGLYPSTNTL